jgi:hypothetical protein
MLTNLVKILRIMYWDEAKCILVEGYHPSGGHVVCPQVKAVLQMVKKQIT